jgi:hypothetical protein
MTLGPWSILMIRRPFPTEWNTSELPINRRSYLDLDFSFEDVASRIFAEAKITRVVIRPYETSAPSEPKDARQAIFSVSVTDETCDLFYNAADGLRGRYWQSPDHGFEATRHLIDKLLPALISFADQNPPVHFGKAAPMVSKDISSSLGAPSAKVWLRERDENGTSLLTISQPLQVPRWYANEPYAPLNSGEWRRTPKGGELEIKGAILGRDATEYLPEGKRDRSWQIHHFGFT